MANLLSPGVAVTTKDLSQVTVAAGDSAACFAGDFVKGPVNVPTLISSVQELKDIFGNPTKFNYNQWYQVFNFLQYSGSIYVTRAADLNGTPTQTALSYNSNEFVASNFEKEIKGFDVLESADDTISFRDNIDLEAGKTIRFNTDPQVYRIVEAERVQVPVENPLFIPLVDLTIEFLDNTDVVEQGQTINYDFTISDGADLEVTSDGADIDPTLKTIKFTKSGLVSVSFVASKLGERPKTLEAQFDVQKIQAPQTPVIAITDVQSGAATEFEVEHEDGTQLKVQIKDDDGLKGKVNVK